MAKKSKFKVGEVVEYVHGEGFYLIVDVTFIGSGWDFIYYIRKPNSKTNANNIVAWSDELIKIPNVPMELFKILFF